MARRFVRYSVYVGFQGPTALVLGRLHHLESQREAEADPVEGRGSRSTLAGHPRASRSQPWDGGAVAACGVHHRPLPRNRLVRCRAIVGRERPRRCGLVIAARFPMVPSPTEAAVCCPEPMLSITPSWNSTSTSDRQAEGLASLSPPSDSHSASAATAQWPSAERRG